MTHSVTYCCVGGRGGGQGVGAEIEGDPIPLLFRPVEISPWRAARGALIFIASLLRKAPKIKIKTSDPDVPPPNPERGGVGEGGLGAPPAARLFLSRLCYAKPQKKKKKPPLPTAPPPIRKGGGGWRGGPWRAARGALIFIASLLRKAPKIKIKTSDPDPSGKEYPPFPPISPISLRYGALAQFIPFSLFLSL